MREETGGKRRGNERSIAFTGAVLVLCAVLIAATAIWIQKNRKQIDAKEGTRVEFIAAPKTVDVGQVTRFKAVVTDEEGKKPLPNRVVDISVGPEKDAQILSVTGGVGVGEKASALPEANHVQGRTDASGQIEVLLRATEAGDFTLSAADTASRGSAAVDFRVGTTGG